MRRQSDQAKERVGKVEKRPEGSVAKRPKDKAPASRRDLSPSEIRAIWNGLDIRVGLFRIVGERTAVAGVATIVGFVVLVLNDVHIGVCLAEGALGAGLVWMLKGNAKRKDSPKP